MVNDPIADLLTRIRNAQAVGHRAVSMPASAMLERVLVVLKEEGFIEAFERQPATDNPFDELRVTLKYDSEGRPVISMCQRVSKSGRRVYVKSEGLGKVRGGLGIYVVSTSQGVMSDREARKRKIGGEVLAAVS